MGEGSSQWQISFTVADSTDIFAPLLCLLFQRDGECRHQPVASTRIQSCQLQVCLYSAVKPVHYLVTIWC